MDSDLDDLSQQLESLTGRFADLGTKLAEAGRALRDTGAPPDEALLEDLGATHQQFADLRRRASAIAESLSVPAPEAAESLADLEPLLRALAAELQARERQAAFETARQAVLATLDRVLTVAHRDEDHFPALAECQAKARAAREQLLALTDDDVGQAQTLTERIRAFSDFLTMVEAGATLDDNRYAQLQESVSGAFGRALTVAAARGRLALGAAGEAAAAARGRPDRVEPPAAPREPAPAQAKPLAPEPAPAHAPVADTTRAAGEVADREMPDETAQWWLAAWARWSGWKSTLSYSDAIREELAKYPYILSVPIRESPKYEEGLAAYGYSIIMEHVEKVNPGCVSNALTSLQPGRDRSVGDQLYDYLVTQGKLAETYPNFVRTVMRYALPEPGVWYQGRILHSREDTRIFHRSSPRIGETEQTGRRLSLDSQRFVEHRFPVALPPLTTRFYFVSADLRDAHGVGVKLTPKGADDAAGGSDSAWVFTVPGPGKSNAKLEIRPLSPEGTALPGLGRDYTGLWIAVFNADPRQSVEYELRLTLRKDTRSPFSSRAGRTAAS